MQDMLKNVSAGIFDILIFMKNFLIGAIVALYVLADKEKFVAKSKMLVYAIFPHKWANLLIHSMRFTHKTFGGFIYGKLVDSAIIGVLCYFGMLLLHMPFPILVSVIIGVTNVIPFFGPFIGAAVGGIIVFMINPLDALWFVILCLILQTFDGYVLGPKILGDSTGLSNFWVIFAIMLFGGLWGVPGWVIGVPLFAVIYSTIARLVNHSLRLHGKTTDSEHMQDVAYYEENNERMVGDATATGYNANRKETNSWARALGIDPEARAARKKEKSEKKEEKNAHS